MKKKSKQVIIILGPPGSGKGTQAGLLAESLDLFHLETSRIIEQKIKKSGKKDYILTEGKKYFFSKEKELWETGKLCDPPFVVYLIREKIKQLAKDDEGIITSGSPRTLYEGKNLTPLLKKIYGQANIKVILLELSPEQTVWRNTRRRICALMRHPILYSEETMKLKKCPLDRSDLIRRKGLDDEETIKVRLQEYKEKTFPLIQYFKEQGLRIKKVDGERTVEDIFSDILKII